MDKKPAPAAPAPRLYTRDEVAAMLDAIFQNCPEGGPYCIHDGETWENYMPKAHAKKT